MRIYQNYHKHDFGSNIRVPDSVCSQRDYAERAKELGHGILSSVAHGWQNRYIDTYELAKEYGLKFVFGTEAYWVKDRHDMKDKTNCHMIIIAKNEMGRRAINKILSIANTDGFYYQPRVDIELLLSLPPDGVIITTACIAGWRYDDAEEIFRKLNEHFKPNFYLEVQSHNTDKQKELNKRIVRFANEENIPLIAGVDSHYIYETQKWERDEFLRSKGITYDDEKDWYMDYPDGDTLFERFKSQGVLTTAQIEEAMDNTNVFLTVEDYDCDCFRDNIKMPTLYPNLKQWEKDRKLQDLIATQWYTKQRESIPEASHAYYEQEIRRETKTVIDTKMSDYFLLNYWLVKKATEQGGVLTNSSRGSSASFYINKLLGFTTIDRIAAPIKMFPERFMSTTRILQTKSLPDIDFNVSNPEVFANVQEQLLGYDHAKPMVAYGTFKYKNAWRMYAKAKNIDNDTALMVSSQIESYEHTLALTPDDEKEFVNIGDFLDEKYIPLVNDSKAYLGIYSDIKVSPCSYLLYSGNISEEIGYIKIKGQNHEEHICCVMDKMWADKYKFLKNDILKVSSIELINRVFKRIGVPLFDASQLIERCVPSDPCWKIYQNGLTMGINQTEQPNTKRKVMRYRPTNISELCAFVAAVRPGFKSMYDVFESRKPFSYGIPSFDNLIRTPQMKNSFVLYQETAMQALNYADIPMEECYTIVKDIAKKNLQEILTYKDRFVKGFANKIVVNDGQPLGRAREMAERVWRILEDSSSYSFNASHAFAMAIDSLYGAWLKAHYPMEFYETFLRLCMENGEKDRMVKAKREAELGFGISFPPYKYGQDNREITADVNARTINMSLTSVKRFSKPFSEILYKVSQIYYPTFTDLLYGLLMLGASMPRILDLIKIQYFEDFGDWNLLASVYEQFTAGKNRISKGLKPQTLENRMAAIKEYEATATLPNIGKDSKQILKNNLEVLGYIQATYPFLSNNYYYVLDVDKTYAPKCQLYSLQAGRVISAKVYKRQFDAAPIRMHDIIYISRVHEKPKMSFVNGKFVASATEMDWWIDSYFKVDDFDQIVENYQYNTTDTTDIARQSEAI